MRSFSILNSLVALLVVVSVSCSGDKGNKSTEETTNSHLIKLTEQQFDANGMKLGKVSVQLFENIIDCNGYVTAKPNGMADISTQLGGLVKRIRVSSGDNVKKGDVLCEITSNEFINLQKNFAETSAKLKQLSADYKRAKKLYEEKIGSEKNFLAIQSSFKAMEATNKALKLQLSQIGLNVSKIEAGNFYPVYPVLSPISGQVSDISVNMGQYIEPQKKLMEVIDEDALQLKLSVFENDVPYLKPGQKVNFYTVNNKDSLYTATLNTVGKSINPETKTIICLANIDKDQVNFVNNSFIRAGIITDKQEAPALPNEAIAKTETGYKVLSLEKKKGDVYYFKWVKVQTGRVSKQFTEILNGSDLGEVLVKGGYNLPVE